MVGIMTVIFLGPFDPRTLDSYSTDAISFLISPLSFLVAFFFGLSPSSKTSN